jgi:hypothetical protein
MIYRKIGPQVRDLGKQCPRRDSNPHLIDFQAILRDVCQYLSIPTTSWADSERKRATRPVSCRRLTAIVGQKWGS